MIRAIGYIIYYFINIIFVGSFEEFFLTVPIFILIISDIINTRSKNIGYGEVVSFTCYLFFVIAPIQQLQGGRIYYEFSGSYITYSIDEMLLAAAAISLFYAFYILSKRYFLVRQAQTMAVVQINFSLSATALIVIFVIFSFILYVMSFGGLSNVLAGRYFRNVEDISVLSSVFLAFTIAGTLIVQTTMIRHLNLITISMFLLCVTLVMITTNPFNAARFKLLACYAPMALVFSRGKLPASIFYLASSFALFVLMPLLSLTTRFGSLAEGLSQSKERTTASLFNLPYMDVYSMFLAGIRYTLEHGYTYGAKLLGLLFFFIPRSIWADKPSLHGLDVGGVLFNLGYTGTDNLSMTFAADLFRDFGLAGAALSGILMSTAIYFLVQRKALLINGHNLLAYLLLASVPILMRGPLGGVIALFFMEVVWIILIGTISQRRSMCRPKRYNVRMTKI